MSIKCFSQVEQIFTNLIESYKDIENVSYDEYHAFIKFKSEPTTIKIRKDVFKLVSALYSLSSN